VVALFDSAFKLGGGRKKGGEKRRKIRKKEWRITRTSGRGNAHKAWQVSAP
jgi:hypothetical protein